MSRVQSISKQIRPLYRQLRRLEAVYPSNNRKVQRLEAEIELIKIRGCKELGIDYEPIV